MSHTRKDRTTPDFLTHFEAVEDPRQAAKVAYPLDEVLLLVLCAVISGADGWTSIALYGEKKLQFLRRFLPFKHGTPSHDPVGHPVFPSGYGSLPALLHSLDRRLA